MAKQTSSADDFTKSFYQLLLEQFGEARGELMTEGEYREWREYVGIQS